MTGRIHIVDDDQPARESLAFLCETGGLSAATYDTPLAFLAALPQPGHSCIVTDVRMPDMDGLTLLAKLRERGVQTPVVVITGHGDVPMAVAAMKAGAFDFLEKPFDDEVFLAVVRAALETLDRTPPRPVLADALADGLANGLDGKLALLSERERQVLARLIEGEPNKVIAFNLGISPRTVEIYRAKVMAKMEAATFADLIRMVVSGRGG